MLHIRLLILGVDEEVVYEVDKEIFKGEDLWIKHMYIRL
jgi:hypothetical protein